ncbi:Transposase [Lunatimonas lonarensis]|uniref:Transposase n=1 Tax=Lunatimonas lonarensis TaxID=1232681 RepID=R7ZTZ8_9BACT|nr:Transposase [Lunatimonas lonarensis]
MVGSRPKIIAKQRGTERLSAMGSYNFDTGQITVSFHKKGNYKSFKKHLKKVRDTYSDQSRITIVLDNVRYRHVKLLKKWMLKNTKMELVYLPPYSPELNPIQRAWWYMRKKITHNRYVHTMEERLVAFWKMFSHFQKPNEELKRFCEINY